VGIEGGESIVGIINKVTKLGTGCRFSPFYGGGEVGPKGYMRFRKRESCELGGG